MLSKNPPMQIDLFYLASLFLLLVFVSTWSLALDNFLYREALSLMILIIIVHR